MDIEDFLKQFIEGYLLPDLASMAAVTPSAGETGACGYSMVLVTLAGCELLGALTFSEPFRPSQGSDHFAHFWQDGLYPTDRLRSELAPAIYKLVRHGLAHAFVTKPLILVTKNKGTKNHLCRDAAGVLTIDCLALADDFRAAYNERFVIPQVQTAHGRSALQRQLDLMHTRHTEDSESHVTRIGSVPDVDPTEAQQFIPSGQVMINSPTLPPRWKSKP